MIHLQTSAYQSNLDLAGMSGAKPNNLDFIFADCHAAQRDCRTQIQVILIQIIFCFNETPRESDMILKGTNEPPIRSASRFGWALMMRTEYGKDFRVIVTDDALLAAGSPCVGGIPQLVGGYRSQIEEIASAKYAGNLIEKDGSILITQADV